MNEAEQRVRQSMRRAKNVDGFVMSARQTTYNKLLGIKDTKAYKQPTLAPQMKAQAQQHKSISGEGPVNLGALNG